MYNLPAITKNHCKGAAILRLKSGICTHRQRACDSPDSEPDQFGTDTMLPHRAQQIGRLHVFRILVDQDQMTGTVVCTGTASRPA